VDRGGGRVEIEVKLATSDGEIVTASDLSQGTLYTLAVITLAYDPAPPAILCIEEIDRGIHPRMLREIRDALYRLSYPKSFQLSREPVQVVATTQSPTMLDLFREHPEEIVIAQKQGREARFERLADRSDLKELLSEGSLGDMWFSGILGGVPEEK
jgi:predicted ATPase